MLLQSETCYWVAYIRQKKNNENRSIVFAVMNS